MSAPKSANAGAVRSGKPRVLIACEFSGTVRDAFTAAGCYAMSADLRPSDKPGPHHEGDVRDVLGGRWDLLIAHPVCTFLSNSGVRWLDTDPTRWAKMEEAAEFFRLFDQATHIPRRCVENPVMHGHGLKLVGRRASQFIQPHQHGDPFVKTTGLWLTGLPLLVPSNPVAGREQRCWKMAPGPDREKERSRTYPGIAAAFAAQWAPLLFEDVRKAA